MQGAIKQLGQLLRGADLDAIVIFGDDQHEQFNDDNMPAVAIYHGETVEIHPRQARPAGSNFPTLHLEPTASEYPNSAGLANHLISTLTEQEFEISRCSKLRAERGIGHAFSFLYQRLWPSACPDRPGHDQHVFPPNQPTPRRCHDLGKAVHAAVGSWTGGERVGVMASGGLSHIMIDEELDRRRSTRCRRRTPRRCMRLPREH